MADHLPFNDFDMAGVTNLVTLYKGAGLQANCSIEEKDKGIVRIAFQYPDGLIVVFDIHKIAKSGFFRKKPHWVIQLHSQAPSQELKRQGCVSAVTQAHVIRAAEEDIKHGFVSVCTFETAADTSD
jgi:hypothetical protein